MIAETVERYGPSFTGRKGGSSSPPPPVRTPDNLRSEDTVEVILGLCEGPIAGLENGAKSFFVGETQLQNQNGEYNFKDFSLSIYPGYEEPAEVISPKLGGETRSNTVGLRLGSNVPVVRQTQSGEIDYIDVRIVIEQLYKQNDEGIFNNSLQFAVQIKPLSATNWATYQTASVLQHWARQQMGSANVLQMTPSVVAGWNTQAASAGYSPLTVSGKTTSAYVREFRIPVARISEPYEVRVTMISPESDTENIRSMSWESYQEVVSKNLHYKNLAVAHLVGKSSDQFSSLPDFTGVYKGLIVRVPSNYNPTTRQYTGVWDGTFKMAWTDNPAWILYDFITNDRYGVSAYFPVVMDKYDVYEAGRWCDEPVPNGRDGTQPRYTFNAIINEPQSGKELAKFIAGTFNAVFFDNLNGTAVLRVDKDDDALHIFTPENVVEGEFIYSWTDLTTRYNDITVAFVNPELNWEQDRRRVFDQNDIDKNGRIPYQFVAVGCIDAHEAVRRAKYKLITSLTETMMVTFKTNRLGMMVQPYDVMLIADPDMGYSMTGRIRTLDAARKKITLRDPIYFEVGVEYKARFTSPSQGIVERNIVVVESGLQYSFGVDAPLPADLPDYAVFSIESVNGFGAPKPFRVISVDEAEGDPDHIEITGIEINRNKWYDSDYLVDSGTIEYSALPSPLAIPGPEKVAIFPTYVRVTRERQIHFTVQLNRQAYPYYNGQYEVFSRPAGTEANFTRWTLVNGDMLVGHPPGQYEFRICPKNFFGATAPLSAVEGWTFDVDYQVPAPEPVKNFGVQVTYSGLQFAWDENAEADIVGYEIRQGPSWSSGEVLITDYAGNRYLTPKKKVGTYTYHICAFTVIDGVRIYSRLPSSFTIKVPAPTTVKGFEVVQNLDQVLFSWRKNPEPDIDYYEIREGFTWAMSSLIVREASNRHSIPSNIPGNRTFWIKAVDKSGNYSDRAAQAVSTFVPLDRHNVVFTKNEKSQGFPGLKYNAQVVGDGSLLLNEDAAYGEYVHEVNLPGRIFARNLINMQFDAVTYTGLKWKDADFTWDDHEAQQPWVRHGDMDSVSLEQQIARYQGLGNQEVEAFPCNDILDGLRNTTPSEYQDVSYAPGRFRNGLKVRDTTQVSWPVSIPSEFRFQFWVRPELLTENVTYLTLRGDDGQFLSVRWNAAQQAFYAIDQNFDTVYAPSITVTPGRLIMLALVQTATERKLFVGDLQTEKAVRGSANLAPLGSFTSLNLY